MNTPKTVIAEINALPSNREKAEAWLAADSRIFSAETVTGRAQTHALLALCELAEQAANPMISLTNPDAA